MTQPQELVPDSRGKVRDLYDLGDAMLLVASDRLSAFDVVFDDPIPYKGEVLTALSVFWFDLLADIVDNHLISTDVADLPERFQPHADYLRGRFMLVRKATVFPVECIVRGYLAGSGWKEYQQAGTVCGIELPAGLTESAKLPETIFTPSTKAVIGLHDENISFAQMVEIVGQDTAEELRAKSIDVYETAREHAAGRGIIIADTKFEFGLIGGAITLVDEVLTPDSSRFWPADEYCEGISPPSFDKQYVRDWLTKESGWDKASDTPPPALPDEVIQATRDRYFEAYFRLVGDDLVV